MPSVLLRAEEPVDHEDCDGSTGDDEENVREEEEAEHIVDLAKPDGRHDEVELDEDGSKGKNTGKKVRWDRAQVSRGGGNLTRNLVCADRGG